MCEERIVANRCEGCTGQLVEDIESRDIEKVAGKAIEDIAAWLKVSPDNINDVVTWT